MPGLANLSPSIIDAITRNLSIRDITRVELRNFLNGRITTVTDEGEFSSSLKGLTQDIEAVSGLEEGEATGSIIGALEGGGILGLAGGAIIFGKGLEIAGELSQLLTNTTAEERSRQNQRDLTLALSRGGVVHGGMGNPTRDIGELIKQQEDQLKASRQKAGAMPDERKFGSFDPPVRQRGNRTPVTDDFEDVNIDIRPPTAEGTDRSRVLRGQSRAGRMSRAERIAAGLVGAAAVAGGAAAVGLKNTTDPAPPPTTAPPTTAPPTITPTPVAPTTKPEVTPQAGGGDAGAIGRSDLRPEFKMLGVEYFDAIFSTPLTVQNSEWMEYNYVDVIDRQNHIEVDNAFGLGIRFKDPLFIPEYQPAPAPPSELSILLTQIPMDGAIQIHQPFMPKFDTADMGRPQDLTEPYNRSVFDYNFKNLTIYNPV